MHGVTSAFFVVLSVDFILGSDHFLTFSKNTKHLIALNCNSHVEISLVCLFYADFLVPRSGSAYPPMKKRILVSPTHPMASSGEVLLQI